MYVTSFYSISQSKSNKCNILSESWKEFSVSTKRDCFIKANSLHVMHLRNKTPTLLQPQTPLPTPPTPLSHILSGWWRKAVPDVEIFFLREVLYKDLAVQRGMAVLHFTDLDVSL